MEAIVIGASGLVGSNLVGLLCEDQRFSKVKIFVRSPFGFKHQKVEEHIIDFENSIGYSSEVKGDVLFSALGTTLKAAGSKEAQYRIDYTYQYWFAKMAAENKVIHYVLVSSAGASTGSGIFYSRIKGELEEAIKKLAFKSISIIRPGILTGKRKEKRSGEKIGIVFMSFMSKLPFLKFLKPVDGKIVAQAMINSAFQNRDGIQAYTLGEVFKIADKTVN